MKRTKNMYIRPSHEATELELYALNGDENLYRWLWNVVGTLKKHYKRGNYNPERAIDAFYPVMNFLFRMYSAKNKMNIHLLVKIFDEYQNQK